MEDTRGMELSDSPLSFGAAIERGAAQLVEQLVFWLPKLAIALLIVLVALRLGRWLASAAARPFRTATPTLQLFIERAVSVGAGVLGFALALDVLGLGSFAAGVLASGSIVAIVLGFAFKEIGTNLIAGVFLAFDRPFKMGDIIECAGYEGYVQALDLRSTHIRNFDGRDIFIPNATIFTSVLVNYTVDDLRRRAFRIGIRYEDDALEAMRLLQHAATSVMGVLAEPAPTAAVVELTATTVELEVAYWVSMNDSPQERARIGALVMDACRRTLLEHGYTVSPNVTTAVELSGSASPEPVHVDLLRERSLP